MCVYERERERECVCVRERVYKTDRQRHTERTREKDRERVRLHRGANTTLGALCQLAVQKTQRPSRRISRMTQNLTSAQGCTTDREKGGDGREGVCGERGLEGEGRSNDTGGGGYLRT